MFLFEKSSSFCRENEIFKKKGQLLTQKRANIGPAFNSTAYIYIERERERVRYIMHTSVSLFGRTKTLCADWVYVPCRNRVFDENCENDECIFCPERKDKGLAPQAPENNHNDENSRCNARKDLVAKGPALALISLSVTKTRAEKAHASCGTEGVSKVSKIWLLVGACLATGSLRQEAIVFQKMFSDPVAVYFLDFRAHNHGLKGPQKAKTFCNNSSFAILSFTPIPTVRSGPAWRQDLAILSPEGPCDSTCQLQSGFLQL